MRAVVQHRYGPPEVLHVAEVETPVPAGDEVLVRVRAATVNQTDCHLRRARPFIWRFMAGFKRPRQPIRGNEFAGEVVQVGDSVSEFAVGDRVFGVCAAANAEYVRVRESGKITHVPAGVSFEEAAALPDGFYQGLLQLRRANVGPGRRLLVYGASGSCGTAAVQLGRHFGAHVTAVCTAKNLELMRSLGAHEVIDYEQEDFAKRGETYDVILDAVGKHSFRRSRRALKPGGLWLATDVGYLWHTPLLALWGRRFGSRKVVFAMPRFEKQDILFLRQLLEAGEYRAVVDRTYPLDQAAEAHRYVETWTKTGNVVLIVDGDGTHARQSNDDNTNWRS